MNEGTQMIGPLLHKLANRQIAPGIFLALVPILSSLLLGAWGSCGMCANEELARLPSPDTALDAVLFQRDCGATTDFSAQVSVVRAKEQLPDHGGNAFVADADHGRAPRAQWGGPPAEIHWLNAHTLLVRYHPASRVFRLPSPIEVPTGWFASTRVDLVFEATENAVGPPN